MPPWQPSTRSARPWPPRWPGGIRGLAAGIPAEVPGPDRAAALAAHARLVAHLDRAAATGSPTPRWAAVRWPR